VAGAMHHPTTPEIHARVGNAPRTPMTRSRRSAARLSPRAPCGSNPNGSLRSRSQTRPVPLLHPGHGRPARRKGNSDEAIMEAVWVAAKMRADAAYVHSSLALEELAK
jgi:hypothetical protein